MALVLEEVPELPSESPAKDDTGDTPGVPQEPPRAPPKEVRVKADTGKASKIDWKEKVPCPGCQRLLSRHTLEFSHQCKGPKKEKPSRARLQETEAPPEPAPVARQPHHFQEPEMSQEQMMRLMIRREQDRREAVMCAPMRRFYGLQ